MSEGETHSVRRHLDVVAESYDVQIRRFIPYYDEMIATGVELLAALAPADGHVLDLGGGTGALSAAARLLAPGGYLLYSTCSLEDEENERVVARVLAGEPDLEPAPIAASPALAPFVDGAKFRLFPDDRCDGFTAHLLRRRPAPTPDGRAP